MDEVKDYRVGAHCMRPKMDAAERDFSTAAERDFSTAPINGRMPRFVRHLVRNGAMRPYG